MDIRTIKEQICDVCHKMWQLGWVAANDGNVSAKLEDGTFLATPTGMSKSFITPEKLIRIDARGNVLEAAEGLRPSSEIKMHLRCYEKRDDVWSVIHAHPPGATGFAVAHRSMDMYNMIEDVAAIGSVPLTPYGTPSTSEVPDAIEPYLEEHDVMLLENHGALAVGGDVVTAFYRMESLELWADVYKRQALEQAYNNKLLVYQSEIKFLQAQVNPHFLYNSFYHLYRMAKMEDNEGVAEMSRRLSSYYRYITRSDQNEVPLTMEYQNISDYTEIQTIRFGDRIKVELEPIPPGYEALMVPRFVLQPLFENAYNHGVEKIAAGRIQLRFEPRPGALVILVENNGTCGDEELRALTAYLESTAPGERLTALKNVKGRMKLLDGDLAVSHGSLGGFCAELTLSVPKDLTANIDKNEREKEEK